MIANYFSGWCSRRLARVHWWRAALPLDHHQAGPALGDRCADIRADQRCKLQHCNTDTCTIDGTSHRPWLRCQKSQSNRTEAGNFDGVTLFFEWIVSFHCRADGVHARRADQHRPQRSVPSMLSHLIGYDRIDGAQTPKMRCYFCLAASHSLLN